MLSRSFNLSSFAFFSASNYSVLIVSSTLMSLLLVLEFSLLLILSMVDTPSSRSRFVLPRVPVTILFPLSASLIIAPPSQPLRLFDHRRNSPNVLTFSRLSPSSERTSPCVFISSYSPIVVFAAQPLYFLFLSCLPPLLPKSTSPTNSIPFLVSFDLVDTVKDFVGVDLFLKRHSFPFWPFFPGGFSALF